METPTNGQLDFFENLGGNRGTTGGGNRRDEFSAYLDARRANEAIAEKRREWVARQGRGNPAARAGRGTGEMPASGSDRLARGHASVRPSFGKLRLSDQVVDLPAAELASLAEQGDGDVLDQVAGLVEAERAGRE